MEINHCDKMTHIFQSPTKIIFALIIAYRDLVPSIQKTNNLVPCPKGSLSIKGKHWEHYHILFCQVHITRHHI